MYENEILAIVLEVAPHTILAVGVLHPKLGMKTLIHGETLGNFLMAFEAFESRCVGPELVARVALR